MATLRRTKAIADGISVAARERLLISGRKLFMERAFSSISADDIARDAGVAHGLLFHYFKSKLGLYLQVYEQYSKEMEEAWRGATSIGPPEERLRRFILVHMENMKAQATNHMFIVRGGAPAEIMTAAEANRMNGVRLILDFFLTHEPDSHELALVRAWLGYLSELIIAWINDHTIDGERLVQTAMRVFEETMSSRLR